MRRPSISPQHNRQNSAPPPRLSSFKTPRRSKTTRTATTSRVDEVDGVAAACVLARSPSTASSSTRTSISRNDPTPSPSSSLTSTCSAPSKILSPLETPSSPHEQPSPPHQPIPRQPTMAATVISYLRVPIAITSLLAGSLSGLLYWKQNELIYPRNIPPGSRTELPRPTDFPEYDLADKTEELAIPTADGERLSAFLIRAPRKPRISAYGREDTSNLTLLMFHGNAGNIGHRLPIAGVLSMNLQCNILMLEYRGYGLSSGVPDENGLNVDAQAGLDFIRSREDLRSTKIILYGQSLGGAVSVQLALRNLQVGDIKAIILENTFLSIRKLIPHALPPAKYLAPLCHQFWTTEEDLPRITNTPFLFLSGTQDEIVPSAHMKRLHSICNAPVKLFRTFPTGQHNSTVACPGYFDAIEYFLKDYVLEGSIGAVEEK